MHTTDNTHAEISFLGAGDCGPCGPQTPEFPIGRYTELIRPVMQSVDLRFGNCERQYSHEVSRLSVSAHGCQPPEMAQIFFDSGFDALTIANNHMYDHGPEALFDTRNIMLAQGIQLTGAGKDLEEARAPAIVERKGVKVGFLGYCSILDKGHMPPNAEAGPGKPGIALLRVNTTYEHRGPHAPVRIRTKPDERDMKMILEDIAALRKRVDVVMIAFHWGVGWLPRVIADYQVTTAHACIDAGADLIMGHHPHIPKAIEMYKGKAIFYSLGNYCKTKPGGPNAAWKEAPWVHGAVRNHIDLDPDYPLLPHSADSKRSILAKAILTKEGVKQVSFLPLWLDTLYRPEALRAGDPRFDDMLKYMDWTSEGFDHRFEVRGDEVVIHAI